MDIVTSWDQVDKKAYGAVLALGNFDGLHKGHQTILKQTLELAHHFHAPAAVLTFEPHPKIYFNPDEKFFALMSFEEKQSYLEGMGFDYEFALPFDEKLSSLSPHDFIEKILVEAFAVKHIVVGYDFKFGHKRGGDIGLLEQASKQYGFGMTRVDVIEDHGEICSSSAVRAHLMAGEIAEATALLGRFWSVRGLVIKGDQRGRQIGFPTANLKLPNYIAPKLGVYAVWAKVGGQKYQAIANFGIRPTFGLTQPLLEVHLFDFNQDIYGQELVVEFVDFIRAEQSFSGIEALKAQIQTDCGIARKMLGACIS